MMTEDARERSQQRITKIGEKALARLHGIHPHLRGKNLKDTVAILKIEERLQTYGSREPPQYRL